MSWSAGSLRSAREGISNPFFTAVSLIKTLVGGGILTLPWSFTLCGFKLGMIILFISFSMMTYSHIILAHSCTLSKKYTYHDLVIFAFGAQFGMIVDVCLLIVTSLGCIIQLMFIGQLLQSALSEMFATKTGTADNESFTLNGSERFIISYPFSLAIVLYLILVPLSTQKNIHNLRYVSTFGVLSYVVLVFAVLVACLRHESSGSDTAANGNISEFGSDLITKSFVTLVIVTLNFSAHFNAPHLYLEMRNRSLFRYSMITVISFAFIATLHIILSLFGYFLFGNKLKPNLLASIGTTPVNTFFRILMVCILIGSFPLWLLMLRHVIVRFVTHSPKIQLWLAKIHIRKKWHLQWFVVGTLSSIFYIIAVYQRSPSLVMCILQSVIGLTVVLIIPSFTHQKILYQHNRFQMHIKEWNIAAERNNEAASKCIEFVTKSVEMNPFYIRSQREKMVTSAKKNRFLTFASASLQRLGNHTVTGSVDVINNAVDASGKHLINASGTLSNWPKSRQIKVLNPTLSQPNMRSKSIQSELDTPLARIIPSPNGTTATLTATVTGTITATHNATDGDTPGASTIDSSSDLKFDFHTPKPINKGTLGSSTGITASMNAGASIFGTLSLPASAPGAACGVAGGASILNMFLPMEHGTDSDNITPSRNSGFIPHQSRGRGVRFGSFDHTPPSSRPGAMARRRDRASTSGSFHHERALSQSPRWAIAPRTGWHYSPHSGHTMSTPSSYGSMDSLALGGSTVMPHSTVGSAAPSHAKASLTGSHAAGAALFGAGSHAHQLSFGATSVTLTPYNSDESMKRARSQSVGGGGAIIHISDPTATAVIAGAVIEAARVSKRTLSGEAGAMDTRMQMQSLTGEKTALMRGLGRYPFIAMDSSLSVRHFTLLYYADYILIVFGIVTAVCGVLATVLTIV